jgi:hypothetical protein
MAKKKIEIVVDLDSDKVEITSDRVLTLTQQVRILKQEIEKAGPGPKQDLLIAKFNEINDELDKTKLKSKEFLGALGTLPGGIGNVAGSLDNAVNQLRDFSSFSLKDIKTQIGGLGDDFKKIGKNLFELTGLSKVYAAANNLLGKSFFGVALGEKAAAYATVIAPFDTGALSASINSRMIGQMTAMWRAHVIYDIYQELGTYKMAAHPFLAPSLEFISIPALSPQTWSPILYGGNFGIGADSYYRRHGGSHKSFPTI